MKIAILTSGVLPVPAVQGGAVENLVDFYLEYNDKHKLHDITVFSIFHPDIVHHNALLSGVNHYHYIDTTSTIAKIKKRLFRLVHGDNGYYYYSVEFFLSQAIKEIRNNHFDIILIENRPGFILKLRSKTDAKIIIHQENDYLNKETCYSKEIYDSSALIINTSEYITRQVQSINPNDIKCKTVFNGIDVQRFFQATKAEGSSFGLQKDDFVIVFSGRLTPEKGILQLIKAIKSLSHLQKLKLLIVGGNFYGKDQKSTSFIEKLKKESEAIQHQVIFTGFINYNQIPSCLKMANIAVVPSMWEEPFGLTVIEAMAAGLPLITTRSGGIPEICTGVATIIERENIVESLAAAILDLYQHPEKRKAMSKASIERSRLFDKDIYARNFFTAIDEELRKQ